MRLRGSCPRSIHSSRRSPGKARKRGCARGISRMRRIGALRHACSVDVFCIFFAWIHRGQLAITYLQVENRALRVRRPPARPKLVGDLEDYAPAVRGYATFRRRYGDSASSQAIALRASRSAASAESQRVRGDCRCGSHIRPTFSTTQPAKDIGNVPANTVVTKAGQSRAGGVHAPSDHRGAGGAVPSGRGAFAPSAAETPCACMDELFTPFRRARPRLECIHVREGRPRLSEGRVPHAEARTSYP
jgi:hypothetical protein